MVFYVGGELKMDKLYQSGYGNRLDIELKFKSKNSIYDDENIQNINILNKHHKRIIGWSIPYRNKYASDRWINDTRGCGWGCIVRKKRFSY